MIRKKLRFTAHGSPIPITVASATSVQGCSDAKLITINPATPGQGTIQFIYCCDNSVPAVDATIVCPTP